MRSVFCLISSLLLAAVSFAASELPEGYTAVEYIDENGCLQTNESAIVVTEATAKFESGWYVVTGEVSRVDGIDVAANGTVNLILADRASLTVQGVDEGAGIDVCSSEILNIYG